MINFLEETKRDIQDYNKTIEDIVFIGSADAQYQMTWEEFEKVADEEYDPGFGAPKVAADIVIVFSDRTYLERREYDGSEWWRYVPLIPEPVGNPKPIHRLIGGSWRCVSELQEEK